MEDFVCHFFMHAGVLHTCIWAVGCCMAIHKSSHVGPLLCEVKGYSPHCALLEGRTGSYYLRSLPRDERPALHAVPWQLSPPNPVREAGQFSVEVS